MVMNSSQGRSWIAGTIMSKTVYNPGCALSIYKPETVRKVFQFLNETLGAVDMHDICCRHLPGLPDGTVVVNTCAGCDRRFSTLYEGIATISLWEVMAQTENFPFPDYHGMEMTIHDACPVRTKPEVHLAVRTLLKRMNIEIVEAACHGTRSVCCGDDFHPALPVEEVWKKMRDRAQSMPVDNVCVYCVSCIKAMHIGGKQPRYILDLLYEEDTDPQTYETVEWHIQLQDFIDRH
jgi:Fe-S oxidoreductase